MERRTLDCPRYRLLLWLISAASIVAGCSSEKPIPATPTSDLVGSPVESVKRQTPVDLQSQGNGNLVELAGAPSGSQVLGGISFQVGPNYAKAGSGKIAVGRRFSKLHLLQATQGGGFQQPGHPKHEQDGVQIGWYEIQYESGQAETLPLVYGDNLRDWWNWDQMRATPGAQVVWVGENPSAKSYNVSVRLYLATWTNPYPERRVETIELIATNAKAKPFCLAMSLEDASAASGVAQTSNGRPSTAPPPQRSAAAPAALPPEIVEQRRRQQEEFEAQKLRNEWAAQVNAVKAKRMRAFDTFTDTLEKSLIAAALKASDARDSSSQSRLAEERNEFARDRLRLPASPEVRSAALNYARDRLEAEQRLLDELQTLESKIPVQAAAEERRSLAEELSAIRTDQKRLAARIAELPAVTAAAPAVAQTPALSTATTAQTPPLQEAKQEYLGPPPAQWTVNTDPPRDRLLFPEKLDYETIEDARSGFVLFPPGRSAFLACGHGNVDVDAFRIYDLCTGKVSGEARGFSVRPEPDSLEGPVLSANGVYLALPDSFEKRILVGDVRQRKAVATLSCDFPNPAVLFPTPDRLLAIDAGQSKRAAIWELPSGKRLLSFTLIDEPAAESGKALCSPGGKYLAFIARQGGEDSEVHFYELAKGQLAGRLRIDGGANVEPRISAIAFSADGNEFAAFAWGQKVGMNLAEVMVCWDLANGRPVYQRILNRLQGQGMLTGANYQEPLQWFPDGQGWLLFHRYVVDRPSGDVTQSLQAPGEANYAAFGTKILDDRRVILSDVLNRFRVVTVQRKVEP